MSDVPSGSPSTPAPSAPAPSAPSAPAVAPAATAKTPAAPKGESAPTAKPQTAADKLSGKSTEAKPEAAPEEPKAPEKRKYKLKVYGQEKELELSDDEIAVRLQKDEAAEVRLAKVAQREKELNERLAQFKKDPFTAAKELDPELDLETLAEQRLAEKYRREMMTEQERAAYEEKQELEHYRKQEKERAESEKQRIQAEHDRRLIEETEKSWTEALAESDLEKSKRTLFMMAQIARQNLDHDIELTPKQLVSEVKRQLESDLKTVTTGMKGDKLARFLGDEVVNEILRYKVEQVKGSLKPTTPPPTTTPEEMESKDEKLTRADKLRGFKKFMRE